MYNKQTKSALEFANLFDRQLKKEAADNSVSNLEIALSSLEKAASLLDRINYNQAAEAITLVLEDFAGK